MAQCCTTPLPHRDCQNPEARAHRKILMLVRLLSPLRRLMMNALRSGHIKHFPIAAQTITKIEILTRRTPGKKRCKPTHRLERFAAQRTRTSADPLAWHGLFDCGWKSIRQRGSDQLAGFKSFEATMQEYSINAPEERRTVERLIDEPAHRRADLRIVPDRFEEFFDPA